MANWNVPYDDPRTRLAPKQANEEAFYAAATSGVDKPVTAYNNAYQDLVTTGQSTFVDEQKAKWAEEDKKANDEAIVKILSDRTLSSSMKRAIVQNYEMTNYLPTTLRDKYITKVATTPTQTTIEDNASQDKTLEILGESLAANKVEQKNT